MSRSGYSDDCEFLDLYRANVDRAIAGKRGQAFLREMAAAMDAMPVKRLIGDQLVDSSGEVCGIGAVCEARGVDVSGIDYYSPCDVARSVGIATALAAEIEWINDERNETPEQRWTRVRKWVADNLQKHE